MVFDFVNIIHRIVEKKRHCRPAISIGKAESMLTRVHSVVLQYQRPPAHSYSYKWKRVNMPLSICPGSEPNPHIVIAGMSGLGKSTLLKSMLSDMAASGIACVLFDSSNEHEDAVMGAGGSVIDASSMGINLLELDGSTIGDRIDELTGLFSSVYSLGYLQSTKLNSCLWYTYMHKGARSRGESYMEEEPSISDLLGELSIFIKMSKSRQESGTLRNMYQKLSTLKRGAFRRSPLSISSISKGISSFSLAGMRNDKVKLIYITELLRRLYRSMHSAKKESGVSMYIMFDESQLILNDETGSAMVGNIIEEGRKFGFGTVIVSHMASRLDRRIIANASTFMTFYAKEPSEINYVSNVLSGSLPEMQVAIKEKLRTLGRHEALLTSGSNRMPVVVSTPRPALEAAHDNCMKERIASMLSHPIKRAKLESIVGGKQVGSALQSLENERNVDSIFIGGEEWLMRHSKSLSIEHEASIKIISEKLGSCNIRNTINRAAHGPDIIAEGGIAIEYETGLKNIGSTKRMLEGRKSYKGLVVIVNDAHFSEYCQIGGAARFSEFISMDCESMRKLMERAVQAKQK
ncbi:MAG: DUF87 domain-containing protein [Candidatus Micrarchaeaceae archaeon]